MMKQKSKTKKLSVIILVMLLAIFSVYEINMQIKRSIDPSDTYIKALELAKADDNEYHIINTYKQKQDVIKEAEQGNTNCSLSYYNQLTDEEKRIYWQIGYAINNYDYLVINLNDTEFGKKYNGLSEQEATNGFKEFNKSISNAEMAYYYDNPKIYWAFSSSSKEIIKGYYVCEYKFYFSKNKTGYTQQELDQFLKSKKEFDEKLDSIAQRIIKKTSKYDNDWEKALYVSKWICDNVKYNNKVLDSDYDDDAVIIDGSIYSAVVNGSCVCRGYTQLYKYLLDAIGIDSQQCTGILDQPIRLETSLFSIALPKLNLPDGDDKGINHIWSIVKLNGECCNVDVTLMDIEQKDIKYDFAYFGVSDSDIKESHTKNGVFDTADCTSTKNSFFRHEGLYSKAINEKMIKKAIQYAIDKKYPYAFIQYKTQGDAKRAYNKFVKNSLALQNILLDFNSDYDDIITIDEKNMYRTNIDSTSEVLYIIL